MKLLANINKTQNSFRLLVSGMHVTHHHSPSCHCQLGLPHQRGGMRCWTPGAMGCDSPLMGLYWFPNPREINPTHLRNRIPDLQSGLCDPPCIDADGSREEKGEGKLLGVHHAGAQTLHHHPPLITSRAWIVKPHTFRPRLWKPKSSGLVLGRTKPKDLEGLLGFPLGPGRWMGLIQERVFSSTGGYQPPDSLAIGLRAQSPIPWGSLGVSPSPSVWAPPTDPSPWVGVTPFCLPPLECGGIYN